MKFILISGILSFPTFVTAGLRAAAVQRNDLIGNVTFTASGNSTNLLPLGYEQGRQLQSVDFVGNDGWPVPAFPLGICQGDCDNDQQCDVGLRCFQRESFQAVPGCSGGESDSSKTDYCIPEENIIDRTTSPRESAAPAPKQSPGSEISQYVGNNGNPANQFPLGLCEGDCDDDSECQGSLICHQRNAFEDIPGCIGGRQDSSLTDYCVDPNGLSIPGTTLPPTIIPSTPPPTMPLVDTPKTPTENPKIIYVGNNNPYWYPLPLCAGDCDDDSECQGNLVCYQRGPFDPIPGCEGGESDSSHTDYCVLPDAKLPKPTKQEPLPSSSDTFRLKLYWEQGYYWQEETRERKWCMMYDYDGLPGSGKCWYARDVLECRSDQVYIAKCSKDPRQKFSFVYLQNGEILIKVGNDKDLCFERVRSQIYLRRCDKNLEQQRWYAPNGDFNGPRFEISQRSYSRQCITNDHHPKAAEVVELHSCRAARSKEHETSFWNKY